MDSTEAINVSRLLHNVGTEGICKGCGAPIVWVRHNNGVPAPYDFDGTNHFVTCPKRDQFKRPKDGK